ncbi:MAG: dihydrolipoamide dehydrogenase, partial [Halobacteriales archaeon]|nr:dihydrolipoamide dehydrogenase [Halobacteriales archaeon]
MAPRDYDLVAIGTGSALGVVDAFLGAHPGARAAVIDKDEAGGICLTRGCIPTKLLVAAADILRIVEQAGEFGIDAELRGVDFAKVMARMRAHVHPEVAALREGLRASGDIDHYQDTASFTAPATLRLH